MTLYICRNLPKRNWVTEADLTETSIGNIEFYMCPVSKTGEAVERADQKWVELTEKDSSLYNGSLMCLRSLRKEGDKVRMGISKSNYKEHHGSCPMEGEQDEWTSQFFPYDFVMENGIAIPKIPNFHNLFPAFAVVALVETSDRRLVYLVRSNAVDNYKGTLSLPSGGRISGNPDEVADDIVADSYSVFDHTIGMMQMEYPTIRHEEIEEQNLTGVARSLDDLDVTLSTYVKTSLTFDQLESKLRGDGKYASMKSVPANPDGVLDLLKLSERFPAGITVAIVQAAVLFNVDPRDANRSIEII